MNDAENTLRFEGCSNDDRLVLLARAIGPAASDFSRAQWVVSQERDYRATPAGPRCSLRFVVTSELGMLIEMLAPDGWHELAKWIRVSTRKDASYALEHALSLIAHEVVFGIEQEEVLKRCAHGRFLDCYCVDCGRLLR